MATQATLVYTITPTGGLTAAQLVALMAAVPVPLARLQMLGAQLISDATAVSGANAVRTLIVRFSPTGDQLATGAVTTFPGKPTGSPLSGIVLSAAGSEYGGPAVPVISGGGNNVTRKGTAHTRLTAVGPILVTAGTGYSAAPAAQVLAGGSLPKDGSGVLPTIVSVTTDGAGHLTGFVLGNAGSGLIGPPTILVTDPTGTGGALAFLMGVGSATLDDPGAGYQSGASAPTVLFGALFNLLYPAGSDQTKPFRNLMTNALVRGCMSPVVASVPVLS